MKSDLLQTNTKLSNSIKALGYNLKSMLAQLCQSLHPLSDVQNECRGSDANDNQRDGKK